MQRTTSIEELCKKLKPIFGEKINQIYFKYSISDSQEEKEEITHILNALYEKNIDKLLDQNILLEPPQKKDMNGEYPIGTISYAKKELYEFNLREQDWSRHVCITGMSGSGKTTLAFQIIRNFLKKDKPFLIFDWKKSFRPLLKENSNIMCITIGNKEISNRFKTNINIPPKNVSPKEWINILVDLLTESFNVSFGVHKILLETIDKLFEQWGVYENSEIYPTWKHIKRRLEDNLIKSKGREAGWIESALRIATILTFGNFGEVINYEGKKALSIEEIFDKMTIFELNSLGSIEKKFFCEFILTYIYKLKKAQINNSKNKFDYAILVDEAHNIFLKNKTNFTQESVVDMIYREMREYGTSLICLDQHISKLSDTVKGNSACHIAFQQQLPQDILEISSLMHLRENKEIFSKLPVGSAIVKLSERYNLPFLIEAPETDLRTEIITDKEIKEKGKNLPTKLEIERKTDPEFNNAIENPPKINITEPEKKIIKKTEEKKENPLNPTQQILYEFVQKKTKEGTTLIEIERILEKEKDTKYFTSLDIIKTINFAIQERLSKKPKNEKISIEVNLPKIEKNKSPEINIIETQNLTKDEQTFFKFLIENPNHEESTTGIYKKINLSTRKGNIVKNELLKKNLIQIQEIKNEKGWKKIIKPIL